MTCLLFDGVEPVSNVKAKGIVALRLPSASLTVWQSCMPTKHRIGMAACWLADAPY